jgi:hypothetical protein
VFVTSKFAKTPATLLLVFTPAAAPPKSASVSGSKSPKAAAASGWGSVIGPALDDDWSADIKGDYDVSAPLVSGVGWETPKAAAAKKSLSSSSSSSKPHSPPLVTGAKVSLIINKYIRMMVKYRQTMNLKLLKEAVTFYDKNKISKISNFPPGYIKSVIDELSSSSATGAAASSDNEKLLDDLADVIIEQKNDSDANTLYPLYNMVEQGNIDDAVQYFLDYKLWDVDYKVLDIFENNPITRSILLALEKSPVAAASAPHASPKAASGSAASAVPPNPKPKALELSKAASADASADANPFIHSILKKAQKKDKIDKVVEKYHRLIREGKMKEASKYSKKHKIAKIPGASDKFVSSMVIYDDGGDIVSITPPADSPVELSPEVLKKLPFSFGQAAAMAAASGTPKAKGKGSIAGTDLTPISKLHKERVHRAVSPTYAKHDPKHGAWAG